MVQHYYQGAGSGVIQEAMDALQQAVSSVYRNLCRPWSTVLKLGAIKQFDHFAFISPLGSFMGRAV